MTTAQQPAAGTIIFEVPAKDVRVLMFTGANCRYEVWEGRTKKATIKATRAWQQEKADAISIAQGRAGLAMTGRAEEPTSARVAGEPAVRVPMRRPIDSKRVQELINLIEENWREANPATNWSDQDIRKFARDEAWAEADLGYVTFAERLAKEKTKKSEREFEWECDARERVFIY